jgi:hypothetical protein
MQQVLMGILLILGIACWWLYSENDATSAVFRSIENDSKELDSLDDPTSDINPNN